MSLSLYQTSVPAFVRALNILSTLLDKGRDHAQANGTDLATMVNARLAPDMYTLAGQVQSASDAAKSGTARLAGLPPPSFPDTETTFDELQARIAKTLDFMATVSKDQIDGKANGVTVKLGGQERTFTSEAYLLGFVLPNFYFHITAAYAILRSQGVKLGKMDYLGSFESLAGG
ncbi:DUF1993 family protein [Rhodoferax sp.]|uniref:DUF1993 domain-containing protein n=1 Tax=Rhodoferax sp. TaxID=50421 RepID=UPI00374D6ABB